MDDVVTGKPVALADIKDFIGFRKVAYITFFLNQLIAPFSPLNFRLLNILIHILNSCLGLHHCIQDNLPLSPLS